MSMEEPMGSKLLGVVCGIPEGRTVRIIFLDFDGVLNSHDFMRRVPQRGICGIDPLAAARLNYLVEATDARVVVSSSWRHSRSVDELAKILRAAGFMHGVVGKTPDFAVKGDGGLWHGAMRGHEIQTWLNLAPNFDVNVDSFVILDDDSDMDHLAHRHVKTMVEHGLTDADVDRAIHLFNTAEPVVALADHFPGDIRFTP